LVNGYCSQSGTDWSAVKHKNRVLVRIYSHDIETTQLTKMQMKSIAYDAQISHFAEKYPEAVLRYEELELQDKLPKLKILPNEVRNISCNKRTDQGF